MNKHQIVRLLYYLIKRLYKALFLFFDELFKPTSFLKGEDFEKCLRKIIFVDSKYDLVMKTHDFHVNNQDYVESSLYPDYLFRDKKTNEEFFVEAKYRENLYQGKINWCKEYQFQRYKKLTKHTKVLVAIGLGGRPTNPKQIFIVPLNKIQGSSLYPDTLQEYEFNEKRKNLMDNLLDHVYDYAK